MSTKIKADSTSTNPKTNSKNPFKIHWSDYGVVSDGSTPCSDGINQAILDISEKFFQYLNVPATKKSCSVKFRPDARLKLPKGTGPTVLDKPIFVEPSIYFQHQRKRDIILGNLGNANHTPFFFGVPRCLPDGSQAVNLTYRPDLFNVLDSTCLNSRGTTLSGPGLMAGFRTNGDACIQSQASPFSAGSGSSIGQTIYGGVVSDNWRERKQITIECPWQAFSSNIFGGKVPGNGISLFGITDKSFLPKPFFFGVPANQPPGTFQFSLATQASTTANRQISTVLFPLTQASIQKTAIQIDLIVGTVSIIDIASRKVIAVQSVPVGGCLAENDYLPFWVNGWGENASDNVQSGVDFAIYGLRISNGLTYNVGSVGSTVTRVDSQPITDRNCYYDKTNGNNIGYFPFDFPTDPTSRYLPLNLLGCDPTFSTSALIMHPAIYKTDDFIGPGGISGVRIYGGGRFGMGIGHGQVQRLTIHNVDIVNSYYGIGTVNGFAAYPVDTSLIETACIDSGYYSNKTVLTIRTANFATHGRTAIRLVGCNLRAGVLRVYGTPSGNQQWFLTSHDGGYDFPLDIQWVDIDFEGYEYEKGVFYLERQSNSNGGVARFKGIHCGTVGRNSDYFYLSDTSPGSNDNPARLIVEDLNGSYGNDRKGIDGAALTHTTGPNWIVQAKNCRIGTVPHNRHNNIYGGTAFPEPRIHIVDDTYTAPPRVGQWIAGGHTLEMFNVGAGQTYQLDCIKSGDYSSTDPTKHPVWAHSVRPEADV